MTKIKMIVLFLLSGIVWAAWLFAAEEHTEPVIKFTGPPALHFQLTPEVSFGASTQTKFKLEKNFDLDNSTSDDVKEIEPNVSLALLYKPAKDFSAFINIEPAWNHKDDGAREKSDRITRLDLMQAYLAFDGVLGFLNVNLGRQRFEDNRQWIYGEEMDGLRLFCASGKGSLEFSATEKDNKDLINHPRDDRVTNFMLYGQYRIDKDNEFAAYTFARHDRKSANENPIFYGLRMKGETRRRLSYWMDFAYIGGKSGPKRISAFGIDLGATKEFKHAPFRPSVSLAYAFGSSDNPSSGSVDEGFRQTSLQDNEAKFNGVTRIKYYGEMFDPELSNLKILTAGVGVRPIKSFSVDAIYHLYRQDRVLNRIRDSELNVRPNGIKKDIGQEVDVVLGAYISPNFKASLSAGYFLPGSAFPDDSDNALFVEAKVRYTF